LKKPQRSPSSPPSAAGVEQLAGAALADDARQHGAGAHVAAGQADAVEQKGGLAARRAQPHIEAMAMMAPAPAHTPSMAATMGCGQARMALTSSPVMRVNISSSGAFSGSAGR
jgi:hypothetical protein